EGGDRAFRAADADMAHAPAGLGADAHADHLVILPQRAVEEYERAFGEALAQTAVHRGAARHELKALAARCFGDREPDRVAGLARRRAEILGFPVQRHL